jgi:hypothetical protein
MHWEFREETYNQILNQGRALDPALDLNHRLPNPYPLYPGTQLTRAGNNPPLYRSRFANPPTHRPYILKIRNHYNSILLYIEFHRITSNTNSVIHSVQTLVHRIHICKPRIEQKLLIQKEEYTERQPERIKKEQISASLL